MECGRAVRALLVLLWPYLCLSDKVCQADELPQPVQLAQRGLRFGVVSRGAEANEESESVFFPVDRATLQRLTKAQELLDEARYAEAVKLLGSILEGPEDFFFRPDAEQPMYRSLKAEAQRLIASMSAKGRQQYELEYGARARQLLSQAVETGDETALAELSRRFFHTQAGYHGTYLLGHYQLDHGQPLAAALSFKRLLDVPAAAAMFGPELYVKAAIGWTRAGLNEPGIAALAAAQTQFPNARLRIGGREQALFSQVADASTWLAGIMGPLGESTPGGALEWPMFRGDASRNATSIGSSPLLNRRWAVPLSDDPAVEKLVGQLAQSYVEQGLPPILALNPLAVRDYVFMRTVHGLIAVDFRTGKRIWSGYLDEEVERMLEPDGATAQGQISQLATWLDQRIWADSTYGTMSSDGTNVYCVEDLGALPAPMMPQRTIVLANGRLVTAGGRERSFNRLAAYEVATEGKLKWEIGGVVGETELPLAGAFFLGPPLPLADRLYVLAEIKGEVRLLALRAEDGSLEWSQQLAVLEVNISDDYERRTAGASPSYSDGVLVCPTSAGAVVAVDLTTRSLLWGFRYDQALPGHPKSMAFGAMPGADENDRWCDSSVTIAEGKVLLAPRESSQLHCLNLLDGTLLWARPRDEGLYVACVHEGMAVVVGRAGLRSFRLSDGQPVWDDTASLFPAGSVPTGRGFFTGHRYYVPLSSAEVAAFDLSSGKLVARSRSRAGNVPGNLICYKGAVISQSIDGLESFYQLDELRREVTDRLSQRPDDASALALQGELLLDEGKLDDAVMQLRRSFSLEADPRTRGLLVDALLEGLRRDFIAYRDNAAEIEGLIDQPAQQLQYLRQVATGQQQAGQIVAAFETYLRIKSLDTGSEELERVDSTLSVRYDRWVQGRLEQLRASASSDQRDHIDEVIRAELRDAMSVSGTAALGRFLDYFGRHPLADLARDELTARLAQAGEWLAAERLLRRIERSEKAQRASMAIARLAVLLVRAGRLDEAGPHIGQLAGPLADTVVLDGKTGRQLLEEFEVPTADVAAGDPWPRGKVEKVVEQGRGGPSYRRYVLDIRGSKAPYFTDMEIELDQPQQSLVARDGLGREQWRVSLADRSERSGYTFNPTLSHARLDGHMLLVSMGFQVLAVDTVGTASRPGPRVLWRHDVTDTLPGMPRHMGIHGRVVNMPWGVPRFMAADAYGRPVGNTGPILADVVCFQRNRNLLAVDPLTGKTVWTRHGTAPGSDIFGDDELLFITPPDGNEAVVVRVVDGQEVGRRNVPSPNQRLTTLGRRVLVWDTSRAQAVLALRDVWAERDEWKEEFPAGARPWPLGDEAVGVLDRQGRFVIMDLADGRKSLDARVDPEPSLTEIYLFRSPWHDVLVTNRPWRNRNGVNIQPVPGGFGNPLINGFMYGFDRTNGKLVYQTRIENMGLTLSQPSRLPVVVFASQVYEPARGGRGQTPQGHVTCIDKRTGRTVYDEQQGGPISTVEISGEADGKGVLLKTQRSTVRLTFTDEPWPAEPPAASPPGGREQSLWRSLPWEAMGQAVADVWLPRLDEGFIAGLEQIEAAARQRVREAIAENGARGNSGGREAR